MKRTISFLLLMVAAVCGTYYLTKQHACMPRLRGDHEIVIAASNSSEADKASADIVCTGKNDEKTIQEALNKLGRYGEVRLLSGIYMIDSFTPTEDGTPYYAIAVHGEGKNHCVKDFSTTLALRGVDASYYGFALEPGKDNFNGVTLAVSKECYETLDSQQTYSVIRNSNYRDAHLTLERVAINLPDNQKNITCVDGSRFESIRLTDCYLQASDQNNYDTEQVPHPGVLGCVGVRCVHGSNNSFQFDMFQVACLSFGVGFEIGGEHLYGNYLSSVFCNYGFTFNSYLLENGVWVHPITLLNCGDEAPCNYPYFGPNPGHQPIDIINFNMEHYCNYFEAGGHYAEEATPGEWTGTFDYAIMSRGGDGYVLTHSPKKRCWEDGHGLNLHTKDNTQKQICSSEERRTYEPNFLQVVYDTDLQKVLICVDPVQKKWQVVEGKVVE